MPGAPPRLAALVAHQLGLDYAWQRSAGLLVYRRTRDVCEVCGKVIEAWAVGTSVLCRTADG